MGGEVGVVELQDALVLLDRVLEEDLLVHVVLEVVLGLEVAHGEEAVDHGEVVVSIDPGIVERDGPLERGDGLGEVLLLSQLDASRDEVVVTALGHRPPPPAWDVGHRAATAAIIPPTGAESTRRSRRRPLR